MYQAAAPWHDVRVAGRAVALRGRRRLLVARLLEADVSDDPFEQGYKGDSPTANSSLEDQYAYNDGQVARQAEQGRDAERDRQARDQQDRVLEENQRAPDPVPYWRSEVPRRQGAQEGPQQDDLLGFYVGIPLVGGLIAAVVALFLGQPPLYWGAVVGGGLFAFFVGLVVVTGGVMALAWTAREVLSFWPWILVVAALGAALGFGVATMANSPSAMVQQRSIDLSLMGGAAGLALGVANRAVRALHH